MRKEKQTKKNNSGKEKKKDESKYWSDKVKEDEDLGLWENLRNNYWMYIICGVLFFLLIYFQYTYSKSSRYESSKDSDVDYYEILGVESNANLPTINKKYRELAKVWHPDKNPGCALCHEKFRQITKAHETLVAEVSKGETGGKKAIFRSNPVFLTTKNYHKLVEESNDFWLILVYEQTKNHQHLQYISEVWDEVSTKNAGIIKFGVIDVRDQENLLHYIPFKFQYFPNIYTYLHNEDCELFHNIDNITPITLQQFIEQSFVSKVDQIDDYNLSKIVSRANTSEKRDVTNQRLSFNDLEVEVAIASPRNYVDLVTKDFARNYFETMKISQNEMGYYDKFLKQMGSNGDNRVSILYNKIRKEENKYTLEKKMRNIPVKFTTGGDQSSSLQNTFNILKHFSLLRIYSNNYLRHCVHKPIEEEGKTEKETFVDICVLFVESKLNRYQEPNLFNSFLSLISDKFESRLDGYGKKTIKSEDAAILNVNYGIVNIDENPEIRTLYKKYLETNENNNNNLNFDETQNLFFIINNTNEKFVFKSFKNSEIMTEYLGGLDNNDYFEDISFSFDYLPNYDVKAIQNLFVEEKHFSIIKVIKSVLYTQMQGKYVFSYMILLVVNMLLLKYDIVKFFSIIFCSSLIFNFISSCFIY